MTRYSRITSRLGGGSSSSFFSAGNWTLAETENALIAVLENMGFSEDFAIEILESTDIYDPPYEGTLPSVATDHVIAAYTKPGSNRHRITAPPDGPIEDPDGVLTGDLYPFTVSWHTDDFIRLGVVLTNDEDSPGTIPDGLGPGIAPADGASVWIEIPVGPQNIPELLPLGTPQVRCIESTPELITFKWLPITTAQEYEVVVEDSALESLSRKPGNVFLVITSTSDAFYQLEERT